LVEGDLIQFSVDTLKSFKLDYNQLLSFYNNSRDLTVFVFKKQNVPVVPYAYDIST